MKREVASRPRWRESLGIVVTILSAVLLGFMLWQISQLNRQGGLDSLTLQRERLAVSMTDRVLALERSLAAYRQAVVLDASPASASALRSDVQRQLNALSYEFHNGEAAQLGVQNHWDDVVSAWHTAVRAKPGGASIEPVTDVLRKCSDVMSSMEDNSNLTYDPSLVAQNLADVIVNGTPIALEAISRSQVITDLATKNGSMSLKQRLMLANTVSALRSLFDLSGDIVPSVTQGLGELLPERTARYAKLPQLAVDVNFTGTKYRELLSQHVLLEQAPTVSRASVDALAAQSTQKVDAMRSLAVEALDASLVRRGEIEALRNRYFYLAFIVGAILFVGIMIVIAQMVARRDRQALQRAQEESARLQAELARQQAEEALRLSEAQFRAVFDGAAVGIAVVDPSGTLVDANGVFRTMFGDSIASAIEGHEPELGELMSGERDTFEFERHLRTPLGHEVWADATISIVSGAGGGPLFAICMFRDKTALKHSERRMLHDKTHDSLTGLPNRQLFEEHLRRRFDEANALLDSFFAVLFVDLEHFKDVNESMGHAAGDLVLTQVAQRLRTAVDARDIVARLGSDEFAVLVQSLGDILHVESIARRILNNLSKVIAIGSRSIYLGASVGIAIGSASYERAEDVMRDAEIAMQHAKNTGGTRYAVFDSKMHARAQKRLQLTSDIRLALERGEFRLLYQPIVNLADGRPVGCEALLRWDHPTEGVINPMDFIPLAEQTGLAIPIGRFVLQTAAEQLSAWRRGHGHMPFHMHVNVSAAELVDPDFERVLVQFIEHHGLAPEDFTIEITESVVLDTGTRATVTLERVRDRGFQICIDDFGTGYSSMRYLQQFKVDAIKIDRMFVAGADGELASEPIVRTLMTLAEAFDVRVVAEGVETARQREVLRNAGCRLAQGYLYARPLSAAEMVSLYPEVLGRAQRSASA